jgi:hypothetical protein
MISCDPNDLSAAAKCFSKLSNRQNSEAAAYLLCQIANGGGGSGNFRITEAGDRRITEAGDPRIIE